MPVAKGSTREYFSKVRQARELLRERQVEILEALLAVASEARVAGEFEVAADILWKLTDHAPLEGDEQGVIGAPASKPQEVSGGFAGPQIAIGIQLGNDTPKQLPQAQVIDVTPADNDE